jgi:RimJ/RimL family protein N-acetyltransferase
MAVPNLQTARLLLRPYRSEDVGAFVALNANGEVRRHVGGPLTRAEAMSRFRSFEDPASAGEAWAVTRPDSGAYIGHCWLSPVADTHERELGLLVSAAYWRQGYGTEIATAVLDYALNQMRYGKVVATVDTDHDASVRMLERVGMKRVRIEQDADGLYFVYAKVA